MSYILALDYMHTILLGVVNKMITLWFDKEYREYNFNHSTRVKEVYKLLESIQPPSFISRTPRGVEKYLKKWKGNTFVLFIIYYLLFIIYVFLNYNPLFVIQAIDK